MWNNDNELFSLMKRKLFSAVVGDIMDTMGLVNQFLSPAIRPLQKDMVVVGRAFPVVEADVGSTAIPKEIADKPFGLMLEALDDLCQNEVYICTGASPDYALWGEIMTARAQVLGAGGAVLDGYSRDTPGVLKTGFPTFSYGAYSQDQMVRGKVVNYRVPIKMGNVVINPGDIVFGDFDGVCIIPQKNKQEIIELALDKASTEKIVHKKILEGMSACEAFIEYGVM